MRPLSRRSNGAMFVETKTRGHARLRASFGAICMFVCLVSHQDCFKGSFGCGYDRGEVAGVGRSALCMVPHHAAASMLPWCCAPITLPLRCSRYTKLQWNIRVFLVLRRCFWRYLYVRCLMSQATVLELFCLGQVVRKLTANTADPPYFNIFPDRQISRVQGSTFQTEHKWTPKWSRQLLTTLQSKQLRGQDSSFWLPQAQQGENRPTIPQVL